MTEPEEDPRVVKTEPDVDPRSELQKQEEAEAAAFARLPKAARIAHRLDAVISQLHHQVKHNAPVAPHHIAELEAIRAEIG
jgi:hypothetical protein